MTTATEQTAPETVQTESAPIEATEPQAFDPAKIDPKVREYFDSQTKEKYKDYDTLKQEADWARGVKGDQRFQKWASELNAPPKSEPFKISADDHAAALGDPTKFQEIVTQLAKQMVGELAPRIDEVQKQTQFAQASRELDECMKAHPEFKELDKSGHILPVLQKYPGISFEDALAIAKSSSGWIAKEINDKATGQVRLQKKAITEKPGNPPSGQGKQKFKSRLKAMEYVMAQAKLGKDVDEDDLDIE